MTPPAADRVETIFHAAADLPERERSGFLENACAGDPALREQVESLLRFLGRGESRLIGTLAPVAAAAPLDADLGPAQIGPYTVVRALGEGGCGVVYVAEQHAPLQRLVAIKVIKLGMDTREVVARFQAERQMLAMMDHPNVASVHDAGATATGRPYFVMELVDGVPITHYCDAHRLPLRARLELLLPVLSAVQHAHSKGIIHRDIKASNVLVTRQSGGAAPKVIDFGIARAIDAGAADQSLRTQEGRIIGTPECMSPEQAAGADIDTRTDVYALGVLLYELLVGVMPFDPRTLRRVTLSDLHRIIRDVDPPRPSTRLSLLPDAGAAPAKARGIEPAALLRQLRGDLDWIVMRCLEKDRDRRYATPDALAADLARFLRHEPISARPASLRYRAGKFVRRNRALVGGATGIAVALVAGFAGTAWSLARARDARVVADDRRRDAEFRAYVANIAAAEGALRVGNTASVRALLDQAPPALRGWEWRYLDAHADDSLATLTGHTELVRILSFSRRDPLLASGSWDGTVRIWNIGAPLAPSLEATFRPSGDAWVAGLSFSPDGARLATGTYDGFARIWEVGTWRALASAPHAASVTAIAFDTTGSRLATGCDDGSLRILDGHTAEQTMLLSGPGAGILSIAFSPDGTLLASTGGDRAVRLWQVQDGTCRAVLTRHELPVFSVGFSPDGALLASSSTDGTLYIWDTRTGEVRQALSTGTGCALGLTFSPDGSHLAVGLYSGAVEVWDFARARCVSHLRGHSGGTHAVVYSPDGGLIASASSDHTVKLWDAAPTDAPIVLRGHAGFVARVAITPDGRTAASVDQHGEMRLWDCAEGRCRAVLVAPGSPLRVVAFSPDSARLGACGGDTVQQWDGASAAELTGWTLETKPASLAYTPDGGTLVLGCEDGTIRLYNALSGEPRRAIAAHGRRIGVLAISPDGLTIAASDDKSAGLWDVGTGAAIVPPIAHASELRSVAFSPDGRLLATGCLDHSVHVLDSATGAQVALLDSGQVNSAIVFSPDGTRLFADGSGDTLCIWDTTTWRQVAALQGQTSWVTGLSMSGPRGGERLIAGCTDGGIRMWDTTPMTARFHDRAQSGGQ